MVSDTLGKLTNSSTTSRINIVKRYIHSNSNLISKMSYNEVLAALKKAITRRDDARMQELSRSIWYDKALREVRQSMGVSASTITDYSEYSITEEDGQYYVVTSDSNDIVAGPFDSYEEALAEFEDDDTDIHSEYLEIFKKYCRNMPGRLNVNGNVGSRNKSAVERFVKAFMKTNPEAELEIIPVQDSEGTIYTVQ